MNKNLGYFTLLLLFCGNGVLAQSPSFGDVFTDNAIIQDAPQIKIWGNAKANEILKLIIDKQTIEITSDAKGRWHALFPNFKVDRAFSITITDSSERSKTIGNILLGDVFLCSGQSNMEFQLKQAMPSWTDLDTEGIDQIRGLRVDKNQTYMPIDKFVTKNDWELSDKRPEWSAVCYFFAKEIQNKLNKPIGIISASWGGSRIEPWMSKEALKEIGTFNDELSLLDIYANNRAEAFPIWGRKYEEWWLQQNISGKVWETKGEELVKWNRVPNIALNWEKWGNEKLANFNGSMWYAKTITLTKAQANGKAIINIGLVEDIDQTWVNGISIGSGSDPNLERIYEIPDKILKEGENVIIVHVTDFWGTGGISGSADERQLKLSNGSKVSIDEDWHYLVFDKKNPNLPRAPWDATGGVSSLYNSMISPLGNINLKGVLWYQGESNARVPLNNNIKDSYYVAMRSLMKDWRLQFSSDLPFLIVQLANFGSRNKVPVNSGWAQVREAQRLVVNDDGNSGFSVTTDIGDTYDIHPTNKFKVGQRIARTALSVVYKMNDYNSGPQPLKAIYNKNKIIIAFRDYASVLETAYGGSAIGFELCKGLDCHFVSAKMENSKAIIDVKDKDFTTIRYCWADNPICNVFDSEDMPLTPFEIEIE